MGIFGNLTQTNIVVTTMVLASNSRNHGVIKISALPQNHGGHYNVGLGEITKYSHPFLAPLGSRR